MLTKIGYSATSQRKGTLKHHTKLAVSHISREDFLGAGPILPLALSIVDLWQYNDTLTIVFRKKSKSEPVSTDRKEYSNHQKDI